METNKIYVTVKVHDIYEMLARLRNVQPNFDKFCFQTEEKCFFFNVNKGELSIRKINIEDENGILIYNVEDDNKTPFFRDVDVIGLVKPLPNNMIDGFERSTGLKTILCIKRCSYLHAFGPITVALEHVFELGYFLILEMSWDKYRPLYEGLGALYYIKNLITKLEISENDIIYKSYLELAEELPR